MAVPVTAAAADAGAARRSSGPALRPAQAAGDGATTSAGQGWRIVAVRASASSGRALVRRRRVLPASPRPASPTNREYAACWSPAFGGGAAGARLAAAAAGLLRRGRDPRPGPVRAAAAAPPHPGHRPARRRAGRRAGAGGAARHRRAGGRPPALLGGWSAGAGRRGRRGRRAAALRRREPRGDQRVRHHAAVPPGPRPGRRAAGGARRAARPVADRWCSAAVRAAPTGTGWPGWPGCVGWTPFGAPWTAGIDVAEGGPGRRRSSC